MIEPDQVLNVLGRETEGIGGVFDVQILYERLYADVLRSQVLTLVVAGLIFLLVVAF